MAEHSSSNSPSEQSETPFGNISDKERTFFDQVKRPVHDAFKVGRVLCPNEQCVESLQFFAENGIEHHFRIKHKCDYTDNHRRESSRICRLLLEKETKNCLEMLFELRETLEDNYRKIDVHSFGRSMLCVVKHEQEAVQFMCLLLYHAGVLQPYSKGNKPSDVDVISQELEAKFHCWYLKKCDQAFATFHLEAFYIKRNPREIISAGNMVTDKETCTVLPSEFEIGLLEDPILSVLQKVFHHAAFRDSQRDVIESLLQDNDVVAIIPTGGGKSICYWIPGIISASVTVVVTPLIALLNDQVSKLKSLNIPVCYVMSGMHPKERESVFHELTKVDTKYKFLYATPEFVLSQQAKTCFEVMVQNNTLSRFIIDEAHCVDTWGNSFRPAYSNLSELKSFMKPVCAFTGTATPRTQEQIVQKLCLTTPAMFQASCNRSNLFLGVVKKGEKHPKEDLVDYIQQQHPNQCGIVYCLSTKDTVELAYILKSKGLRAVYYHGQLDHFEKAENAKAWLNGQALIMCATSAFGMGIDKPDVRFVIHITLPRSIEDYYQEAGRAGRDGNPSNCIVMFKFGDRNMLLNTLTLEKSDEERAYLTNSVNAIVSYCMSTTCRRKLIMEHFEDKSELDCGGTCDNCLKPAPPPKDYTDAALTVCKCLEEMQIVTPFISIRQLALTFKGSKSKKDVESKGFNKIEHYGAGQKTFKNDAEAITFIHHLVLREVLHENERVINGRRATPFVILGHKLAELKKGDEQILINL